MLRASALVIAGLLTVTSPAMAQRAPVTRGVTSSDLATQVDEARQQSAELKVQMNGMLGDIMNLTGRVETLEYNLAQSETARDQLSADNETLARELNALKQQMRALQAQLGGEATANLQSYSGGDASENTSGSAPRTLTRTVSSYPGNTSPAAGTSADAGSVSRQTTTRSVTRTGPTRIVSTAEPSEGSLSAVGANDGTGLNELPAGSLGTIPASALPGDAGQLFAAAKSKFIRFDYAGAEEAFSQFIEAFGDDPQVGEAHYWMGEAMYNQKAYAEAGSAYTTMIRSYPDDPRAPDALVRLARVMRLVGDTEKACLALDTLPKRYPMASGVTNDLAAVERTKSRCDS